MTDAPYGPPPVYTETDPTARAMLHSFLINDSSSPELLNTYRDTVCKFLEICREHNQGVIHVYFCHHRSSAKAVGGRPAGGFNNITKVSQIHDIFAELPKGTNTTDDRLESLWEEHFKSCKDANANNENALTILSPTATSMRIPAGEVDCIQKVASNCIAFRQKAEAWRIFLSLCALAEKHAASF